MTAMDHRRAVETLAVERYLLGELNEQERDAFEDHFFSCAECAEDVRSAGALRDAVAAGTLPAAARRPDGRVLELPAPPARRRRPATSAAIALPWALAASFAVVAGYQTLVVQPALRRSGPLVLSPVTLRPSSRGREAEVFASAGGLITLAVDLGGVAVSGNGDVGVVAYEIRRGDGTAVASDRGRVSSDGAPLLLAVPASLVTPGEHYVLSIKDPRNPPLTLADYRFTVGVR